MADRARTRLRLQVCLCPPLWLLPDVAESFFSPPADSFLRVWDLPLSHDLVAVIAKVTRDGMGSRRLLVAFRGVKKVWASGSTCQRLIAALYGPDTRDWIGKPIALYVDPNVKFGGASFGGIRVRPSVPRHAFSLVAGSGS